MTLRAHGASRDASSKEVVPPIRCPLVFYMPQEFFHATLHQLKLYFLPLTSSITILECLFTEGLEAHDPLTGGAGRDPDLLREVKSSGSKYVAVDKLVSKTKRA
ncbi:hypothetical protein MRX96_010491 [Rhipicephalus microplus]